MKLALVTAGYRRIGAAIAGQLAQAGWTLALHSRTPTQADQPLAAALALHETKWQGFEADLADPVQVSGLLPRIAAHFGTYPRLIVNNASIFEWDDLASVTADRLSRHMNINLNAPVLLATALAAALGDDGRACVINILDQRIRQPNQDQLSYTLSKQALAGATETLARALAPYVRVNAVAPGLTLPTSDYLPAQMTRLTEMMPLALLPEPEDIADAVMWLANARATTGQTVFVDGGASLKSFARDFVFLGLT